VNADAEVLAALDAFDRAFAAGDAEAYASLFAEDGQMLLLYADPLVGREEVRTAAGAIFAAWNTTAWRTQRMLIETCGETAWALSTYTETQVHREDGHRQVIHGRLLQVLRREAGGGWRFTIAMNSHSRRVEELPAATQG
jgi:uncharacterized protein (TIGR02246 family)